MVITRNMKSHREGMQKRLMKIIEKMTFKETRDRKYPTEKSMSIQIITILRSSLNIFFLKRCLLKVRNKCRYLN